MSAVLVVAYLNHLWLLAQRNCIIAPFRQYYRVDSESVPVSLRKVIGDASESGILRFCEELKPVADTRTTHPKVVEFPFNSTNKYQVWH